MIQYDTGKDDLENWLIAETDFDSRYQGKTEAIFCLANGYMGVRSATEERYINQVRNTFVAGTYNKFAFNEVTELPNAADVFHLDIWINGQLFSLENGTFSDYRRTFNLQTAELTRSFIWTDPAGKRFSFRFRRFVSLADLHLLCLQMQVTALEAPAEIKVVSGIDGRQTNTGVQHFREGEKRVFDRKYLQLTQTTTESNILFTHNALHDLQVTGSHDRVFSRFALDRRKIFMEFSTSLAAGETLELTKKANVYTSRDIELEGKSPEEIQNLSHQALQQVADRGYEALLADSISVWKEFWQENDVQIQSSDNFDQLAVRFALYHLRAMTPAHDDRLGIGAKGLSGEGYKGHAFWDTEIFILPFFTFSLPEIARRLLIYRYKTLAGARKKARENGYRGAMYPWESAWMDDGEVTPVWGSADIVTGEAMKIWSGFIEQHITADVAFAVWQYYQVTGDEDFMEQYGYEILLDTGIFWASRLEWNDSRQQYHINDVIGPDEYKEHVNNDAFTNYMAAWCMENAVHYYHLLKKSKPQIFTRLNEQLGLEGEIATLKERLEKIYLPQPNQHLVIPQDDGYLNKKIVDLSKYKNQQQVGSIFLDYNLEQINEIQVSKQASVVMLLYLLEHKFSREIKIANYRYYEPKTLHDSSLSLSTHAVLAADIGELDLAYQLFQKACRIDLGPNMKSSDHGIHAASLGGIWQIVVNGFGGVRMVGGQLRINPKLPENINELHFTIQWRGNRLSVNVDKAQLTVRNEGKETVTIRCFDGRYEVRDQLRLDYSKYADTSA